MDKREIREILTAHADQLNSPYSSPSWQRPPSRQVQELLELAEQLQGILTPVRPDVHFRRRLHGDLILAAQRRQAEPGASLFRQHRKGILIGAAAAGSVASVVGVVVAFVLRYRHGQAAHIAPG